MARTAEKNSNFSVARTTRMSASDSSDETDINEAFDDIFLIEERCRNQGYLEGLEEGKTRVMTEGFEMGMKKGMEIGREIGFYKGSVDMLLRLISEESDNKKQRIAKLSKTLLEMLCDLPFTTITTEEHLAKLQDIRGKFKRIQAMLDVKPESPRKDTSF